MTTTEAEDLRKTIYGLSFAVGAHPNDFVLRINQKGVEELLGYIKANYIHKDIVNEVIPKAKNVQRGDPNEIYAARGFDDATEIMRDKLKELTSNE